MTMADIEGERATLARLPASHARTHRLNELAEMENSLRGGPQPGGALAGGVSAKPEGAGAAPRPTTADEALSSIESLLPNVAQSPRVLRDEKRKEEPARTESAHGVPVAGQPERRKEAPLPVAEPRRSPGGDPGSAKQEAVKEPEKPQDRSVSGDPGDPSFEERWADVILKIKKELQRYKRW